MLIYIYIYMTLILFVGATERGDAAGREWGIRESYHRLSE